MMYQCAVNFVSNLDRLAEDFGHQKASKGSSIRTPESTSYPSSSSQILQKMAEIRVSRLAKVTLRKKSQVGWIKVGTQQGYRYIDSLVGSSFTCR
jgi:hypothetical protein